MRKVSGVFFQIAAFLFVGAFSIIATGCMNDIDTMIEDYNSHFKKYKEPDPILLPGDPGFDPSTMLKEKYTLGLDQSLTLTAPKGVSYQWAISRVEMTDYVIGPYVVTDTKKTEVDFTGITLTTQQAFQLTKEQVQDVFSVGTYEIRLVVEPKKGAPCRDAAELFVVRQFYEYF